MKVAHTAQSFGIRAQVHGMGMENAQLCAASRQQRLSRAAGDGRGADHGPQGSGAGLPSSNGGLAVTDAPGLGYDHDWAALDKVALAKASVTERLEPAQAAGTVRFERLSAATSPSKIRREGPRRIRVENWPVAVDPSVNALVCKISPSQGLESDVSQRVVVTLSEVLGALRYALDITEGQPVGHSLRACWIGMHVGKRVGLDDEALSDLYFTLLLEDVGCSFRCSAHLQALSGRRSWLQACL